MTIEQYRTLESKAQQIKAAIDGLETALIDMLPTADDKDREFIAAALTRISDDSGSIIFSPYWWHPQPEWTGGDSSDPKNTKYNPPHIVGALRATATAV